MKITQDVRDYAATLNDPQKRAIAGESLAAEQSAAGATGTQQEAGSAAGATGTQQEIEAGMASMSKKFLDLGADVYVDAEKVKESNKAL
jgi:phosphomethylpyrimidine synthase